MRGSPPDNWRAKERAFTLVELIIVMVLLGIAAAFVAPHMSSFFRGRALNSEGRRLLALTHYAQTRAAAEGVPVLLWVNAQQGAYGLITQTAPAEADDKASTYTVDPTLTLETVAANPAPVSEDGTSEQLGGPAGLPVIRFLPDGYYDPSSIAKIVLRQGSEAALELVPDANRLGYEILPYTPN
jgi:type II secretion system protein H